MSFRPPLWIPDGRPIMLGHTNGECHSCASIAAQTRFWTRRATDPTVGGDLFQLTEGGKLGLDPVYRGGSTCCDFRRLLRTPSGFATEHDAPSDGIQYRASLNLSIGRSTLARLWGKSTRRNCLQLRRENVSINNCRVVVLPRLRQCCSGSRLPGIVVWEFRYAPVRLTPSGSSPPDGTQHSVVCPLDRKQCACDGSSRGRQSCHTQGGVSYQTI